MIGFLRGKIALKQAPTLWIDVNGVGYEVEAPMSTFYQLGVVGSDAMLFTHLTIRDDAHLLFAFASESERDLFRELVRVNGVGAKLALAVLSGMSVSDFMRCIREHDVAMLVRLPGVGKKTAERLVVEMQGRFDIKGGKKAGLSAGNVIAMPESTPSARSDALHALVALGYKQQDASRTIDKLDLQDESSEDIIRLALQSMVSA